MCVEVKWTKSECLRHVSEQYSAKSLYCIQLVINIRDRRGKVLELVEVIN